MKGENRLSGIEEGSQDSQKGGPKLKVRSFVKTFSHPDEHKEFIDMINVGLEFNMPYRAIMEFYGRDLIAYKRKFKSNQRVNDFLRTFSHYMKEYYDRDCPQSWEDCQPTLWEELITAYYPSVIKITSSQKETQEFLFQLKKFVRWLDKEVGCSWYKVVSSFIEKYTLELIACEAALNNVFQHNFPKIHEKNWNPTQDIDSIFKKMESCSDTFSSLFEVLEIHGDVITVCDNELKMPFPVHNFPVKYLHTGMMLCGVIGKESENENWTWYITEGVYPHKAGEYIKMVD